MLRTFWFGNGSQHVSISFAKLIGYLLAGYIRNNVLHHDLSFIFYLMDQSHRILAGQLKRNCSCRPQINYSCPMSRNILKVPVAQHLEENLLSCEWATVADPFGHVNISQPPLEMWPTTSSPTIWNCIPLNYAIGVSREVSIGKSVWCWQVDGWIN